MSNVFEFLGKPADFRTEKKVVQLVKHFDDVNPKASEGIFHKKVNFPMYGQVKRDGVFCMVVVKERYTDVEVFNRTGKKMTNTSRISTWFKLGGLRQGVYLGELLSERSCSLEQLSGTVNPNRVNPLDKNQVFIAKALYVDFFDGVTLCEFISGHSHRNYSMRHKALTINIGDYADALPYRTIRSEEGLRAFAQRYIDAGEEGAVFKQDVEWKAGAKDWHQMKIVCGVSYDLECIGYEEGTGKYEGKVANLLFRWKGGKTIKCMLGKGWTHNDAEQMYLDTHPLCEQSPVGKIFEVYALQESSKGKLRLPKVGEARHDKFEPDF